MYDMTSRLIKTEKIKKLSEYEPFVLIL